MSTPIIHSATFAFENLDAMLAEQKLGPAGSFYQREGHPTLHACEQRMAMLEGAQSALMFSSGMAALSSLFLALLQSGDHVVALDQTYGGTRLLLEWGAERFGWTFDVVDAREPDTWPDAFQENTKIFHVETPTNPTLCIVDLKHAADVAHKHGARLVVDNTVATPAGQQPLALGADFVMHSATKGIGGHSDLMAGFILGDAGLDEVWKVRKIFGPIPDPALAWLVERSLRTLPLRIEACNGGALELAVKLTTHPGVAQVFYPGLIHHPLHETARRQMALGFGPLLSFEVKGGLESARNVLDALQVFRNGSSFGGIESLASLPAHTSHVALGVAGRARSGIPEGCLRLSVGIEEVDDLWADLDQALARASVRV